MVEVKDGPEEPECILAAAASPAPTWTALLVLVTLITLVSRSRKEIRG
jgi:hypothetical protein